MYLYLAALTSDSAISIIVASIISSLDKHSTLASVDADWRQMPMALSGKVETISSKPSVQGVC